MIVIILVVICGAGTWYLYSARRTNENAARNFAKHAVDRLVNHHDERFLDFTLAPEAQIEFPPWSRVRFVEKVRTVGKPEGAIDIEGDVMFTSQFFEPRGEFRVKYLAGQNAAYLDLAVSRPRALWQIDKFGFTWAPRDIPQGYNPTRDPPAPLFPKPSPSPTATPKK